MKALWKNPLRRTFRIPHYTRPEDFRGKKVPKVLLSGHRENIRKWRRTMSLKLTKGKKTRFI